MDFAFADKPARLIHRLCTADCCEGHGCDNPNHTIACHIFRCRSKSYQNGIVIGRLALSASKRRHAASYAVLAL